MLYFDRIDIFEGIDVNKTSALKDYDICHYWYFLNKGFKFQPYAIMMQLMMPMNVSDIVIFKIKNTNYCCIITGIGKSEAIDLM